MKIRITGVCYPNKQRALEHFIRYKAEDISIQLVHKSSNAYNRNAVQVVASVKNKVSYCIGYLPQGLRNSPEIKF